MTKHDEAYERRPRNDDKPVWATLEILTTRSSDRYPVPAVRVSEATTERGLQRSFSVGVVDFRTQEFVPKPHVQQRYLEETIQLLQDAAKNYPREVISSQDERRR